MYRERVKEVTYFWNYTLPKCDDEIVLVLEERLDVMRGPGRVVSAAACRA